MSTIPTYSYTTFGLKQLLYSIVNDNILEAFSHREKFTFMKSAVSFRIGQKLQNTSSKVFS
jgi:hypothetical protein